MQKFETSDMKDLKEEMRKLEQMMMEAENYEEGEVYKKQRDELKEKLNRLEQKRGEEDEDYIKYKAEQKAEEERNWKEFMEKRGENPLLGNKRLNESASLNESFSSRRPGMTSNFQLSEKIKQMKNKYSSSIAPRSEIVITPADYSLLSKSEKATLHTLANMYGILTSDDGDITFSQMTQILKRLTDSVDDISKNYLIYLFFPEKAKNIHQVFPFPQPTYTFRQYEGIPVFCNSKGNFLIQFIVPLLLDSAPVVAGANYTTGNQGTAIPPIWNGNVIGLQNGNPAGVAAGSVSNLYINNR